jgi:lipoate-protein ligase A
MTDLHCLDLSLRTPAENLACDEALLDCCEAGESERGILRFWEADRPFVVLGYANRAEKEVDLAAATSQGVPVLRRCSGGGTVLQMRGCLNYSLVLRIDGSLSGISETNCLIMKRNAAVFEGLLGTAVDVRGHTDLAINNLKFSGNAQRRKRHWLLFHGTFVCRHDPDLMHRVLKHPPKEPEYRARRAHRDFMTSVDLAPETIKRAMRQAWNAHEDSGRVPAARIEALVNEKYSTEAWNLKW